LAVKDATMGVRSDPRLIKSPLGLGETDPSGGGFTLQPELAREVITKMYDLGHIASRVRRLPISGPGLRLPAVDERSRVTGSRWGGIQTYLVNEGTAPTATQPKFRLIELNLRKLMSVWYLSDELMEDSAVVGEIANQAFAEELVWMLEYYIFSGTGAGEPLGILNHPATVSVAADKGQPSKTLTQSNIVNMYSHLWSRSAENAVWFINQDVIPQLFTLSQTVGVGGQPMFFPAGGMTGAPTMTLLGKPVIMVEQAQTLGTPGDIILADMSQYVVVERNAAQFASSMHVQFLTDQMAFRVTYRFDGSSLWHTSLTPANGTSTKSPFITLAAR